jgi:flagellar basal body-associated protein FliL
MTYLLFGTALALSACAAYYSIMGLVAIFAAAAIPIFIMGSLLEASKLVVASWLYRNWKEVPVLMKSYFTVSLIILMMLTSMGIFGYLSKAHLDQAIPTGDVSAKLALIDEKIKTEKENINANRKELTQLDAQVDQTLSRTTEASGADRSIVIRRAQQKDRTRILNEIGQAQAKIAKYNEERAPIASEVRKVEAEVGPIKYIAALLYGDNPETDVLEKAVRWVIIMIVLVFDPLAVLLLVAANWQQKREREETESKEVFIDEGELPPVPDEINQTEIIEPIKVELTDEVPVWEEVRVNIKPEDNPIDHTVTGYQPAQVIDEELNITVEETKDWEPNLYNRLEKRDESLPEKTQSFLNKAKEVFSSIGIKTIEKEVDELQDKKPK